MSVSYSNVCTKQQLCQLVIAGGTPERTYKNRPCEMTNEDNWEKTCVKLTKEETDGKFDFSQDIILSKPSTGAFL